VNKHREAVVAVIKEYLPELKTARRAVSFFRPYERADETVTPKSARPSSPDPDLTARGVQVHARVQNQLADEAARRCMTPYSPDNETPSSTPHGPTPTTSR